MKNTVIKKMAGCLAASTILATLAIGTVFAAGTGRDTLNSGTETSAVELANDEVIFTWSGDYTEATATFINENSKMEVVDCDVLIDAESDQVTYTAICSHNTEKGLQTFKDVKVVNYSEMKGNASIRLADDGTTVAVFRK